MAKFQPGQSGNPGGRPKKDTAQLAEKLKTHGESVLQVVVDQALKGDLAACKLILDRLYPPIKPSSKPVQFEMIQDNSLSSSGRCVLNAVASGDLPPDTGIQMIQSIASLAKIIEVDELTSRIEVLETKR